MRRFLPKQRDIVFNISPESIRDLEMMQEAIRFTARFDGVAREINVGLEDVLGMVSRERMKGILFPGEQRVEATDAEDKDKPVELKLV